MAYCRNNFGRCSWFLKSLHKARNWLTLTKFETIYDVSARHLRTLATHWILASHFSLVASIVAYILRYIRDVKVHVLAKEQRRQHRKAKETIYTKQRAPTMNRDQGCLWRRYSVSTSVLCVCINEHIYGWLVFPWWPLCTLHMSWLDILHCSDVIMNSMASQITSLTIV